MRTSAHYGYRAARGDGSLESGSMRAANRDSVAASLAARGLFPLEIRVRVGHVDRVRAVPVSELALGLRVLATLLESGLPTSRALAALDDAVPAAWRAGLPAIRSAVREGSGLAASLSASPLAFPPLVLGIIEAGEAGSGLAAAVGRAAEALERDAAWRATLRSALAYPAIVAIAGGAAVALLIGVVLPRFTSILDDLGQELPTVTRALLQVADLGRVAGLPALVLAALAAAAWRGWVASPTGRERWHALLLRIPWVGPTRRAAAIARACAALAGLLHSGVPVGSALVPTAAAAGDAALGARLLAAREAVLNGRGIAAALEDSGAATPTVVRLTRAGEETGRVADLLALAARLEAETAERRLRAAARLVEPMLILVFAGLVAWVAAALLQAVYSVRPGL